MLCQAEPVQARVISAEGTVEYAAPGEGNFQPLSKDMLLLRGSVIRTGDDGQAVVQTTPGSAISIESDTIIKINELAFSKSGDTVTQRKARLDLRSGAVSALIDPSTPSATDYIIETPQGGAAARGTFYAVIVKNGKTYVGVGHGKVAALASTAKK